MNWLPLLLSSVLLLLVAASSVVQVRADDDDGAMGANDIKSWFDKFFKPQSAANAFKAFLKESSKKMGMNIPDADEAEQDKGDDDKAKKDDDKDDDKKKSSEEVPLPAKVFVFYGKTFGCAKSKIYQEFAKNYKADSLPTSDVEEEADDKWLRKLTNKPVDVDDPKKPSVEIEDAKKKLAKLGKDQIAKLNEGESQMPLEGQIFLHFIKSMGCQDAKFEDYKKFNDLMKDHIDKAKKKNKKVTPAYALAKADTILHDEFE